MLVQVDPVSGKVVKRTPMPFGLMDLAYGNGSLWGIHNWTGPRASVVRLDPSNANVVATVQMPANTSAGPLVAAGADIWVGGVTVPPGSDWKNATRNLYRIGTQDNHIDSGTPVPLCYPEDSRCSPNNVIVNADGALWMAGSDPNTIVEFDPSLDKVTRVVDVGGPHSGIAVGDGKVWTALRRPHSRYGSPTKLLPIDESAGRVGQPVDPRGEWYPQAVAGGQVIASGFGGVHHDLRLALMDTTTGVVTNIIDAGSDYTSAVVPDPSHQAIWIVHPYDLTRVTLIDVAATSTASNGQIAYMCGVVICVVNPNGSHLEKIDNGLHRYAPEWEPAWSADGTKIAFRGYFGPGEGYYALFSMNADGSDLTRLQNGGERPSWSPDGSKIVFDAGGIRVMNADGSDSHPLIRPADRPSLSGAWMPSWSPSKDIVFVGTPDGQNTESANGDWLYVVHTDGSGLTKIPNTQKAIAPAWSPDGSTIVFYRSPGANYRVSGIYTVRPDGSHLTEVVPPTGQAESPVFTPDGRAIAYFFGTGDRNGVYLVRPDGTGNHRLDVPIDTPEFNWQPVP